MKKKDKRLLREAMRRAMGTYRHIERGSGRGLVRVTEQKTGIKRIVRVKKSTPPKCKTPRQICIRCLVKVIPKLSKFYASRVCEECTVHRFGRSRDRERGDMIASLGSGTQEAGEEVGIERISQDHGSHHLGEFDAAKRVSLQDGARKKNTER